MKRVALLGLALAFATTARGASADPSPSMWASAKDPGARAREDLHADMQRRIMLARLPMLRGVGQQTLDAARVRLEEAGARESTDVRLRFDLGTVYELLDRHALARTVLSEALAIAPHHTAAEDAWITLAFACGKLGDHACERRAYNAFLSAATEDSHRVTAILNLAETEMHLGRLAEAIDGYRDVMRICNGLPNAGGVQTTRALATWGLAVALDRHGDPLGAMREAKLAVERSGVDGMGLLRSPSVFYVPDYEVSWYEGLGAMAVAPAAKSATEAWDLWRFAERSFDRWITGAEPKHDRWLPLARAHLARAREERKRAEARKAREPRPRVIDEDVTF
jgi:tetratricopeptide (TPR) repeat protein